MDNVRVGFFLVDDVVIENEGPAIAFISHLFIFLICRPPWPISEASPLAALSTNIANTPKKPRNQLIINFFLLTSVS